MLGGLYGDCQALYVRNNPGLNTPQTCMNPDILHSNSLSNFDKNVT